MGVHVRRNTHKKYVDLSAQIKDVFALYEREVRAGEFPAEEHCFGIKNKQT